MKLVTAIIKPVTFDNVYASLENIGVAGITATEVQGVGRERNNPEIFRGAVYTLSFRSKIKIEVAVADEQLDAVIEVISNAARTGGSNDGSVFVTQLEQAIRIRAVKPAQAAGVPAPV